MTSEDGLEDNSNSSLAGGTQLYAASLANPFAEGPDGAFIPDTPALMTRRLKVFSKGTFGTSANVLANGIGWICVDPLAAFGNDTPYVTFNDPNSPTPAMDIVTSQAGGFTATSNSDFVRADLSAAGIQARVVSSGLRIRNVTAVLNRGGYVVGLHEPAHTCLQNFTIPAMDSYLESGRVSGTVDDWTNILYRPVDTDDVDFQTVIVNPGAAVANTNYMGFIVQSPTSAAAGAQLYEYEAFTNLEAQGARAVGKEPSHADPNGFAAVNAMTVFSRKLHSPHQEDSQQMSSAFVSGADHYLNTHMSQQSKQVRKKKKTSFWTDLLGVIPSVAAGVAAFL